MNVLKDNNTMYHDDDFFPAFDGEIKTFLPCFQVLFLLYFNIQKGFAEAS